ncbi:MAG: N-acetyl-gamma-glutamyl-phosphate reductase [Tunicatimonas sp.]
MNKARIGIVGGAGYTAGELLRLLALHPRAEVAWVHSSSQAGRPIAEVHQDLVGETALLFTSELDWEAVDALFLCSGHGASANFLKDHDVADHVKIIDLSQDFRAESPDHTFVYGLPELQRDRIRSATRVANPGCFATCIQLGLLPLAKNHLLTEDVHIHAITGSTGAGQQPSETTHFSWRNNNVSVYKPFRHQHLREIGQSMRQLQPDFAHSLNFIPVRGNFARGIFASLYVETTLTTEAARQCYADFYRDAPFVTLTPSNPHLKQVVNTNKAVVFVEVIDNKLLIISTIDNLIKGASGQAIQNMNLMMGWDESAGLQLKAGYF